VSSGIVRSFGKAPVDPISIGAMKPAERIPLLKKLANALSDDDMSWDDMELTLRQFGFSTENVWGLDRDGEYDGPESYGFALHHLESSGSDEALLELERYLDPSADTASPATLVPGPWKSNDTFRLFISHTHDNAKFAGTIKYFLGRYRIECFVAHSDITPSEKWMEVIRSALLTSHALAALVTDDFRQSQWCDQEIGFALARSMLVVPLMYDVPPHGFLSEFQAIKLSKGGTASAAAVKVFNLLAKHKETRDRMAGPVVRRFVKSTSFDSARQGYFLLKSIPKDAWTPGLVREVWTADRNDQVKNANLDDGPSVPDAVKKLLAPIETKLDLDGDFPF
jgi:hypothetical protein